MKGAGAVFSGLFVFNIILTFAILVGVGWGLYTLVDYGVKAYREGEHCTREVMEQECAAISNSECRELVCLKCNTRCSGW